jgi:hypothetical protein
LEVQSGEVGHEERQRLKKDGPLMAELALKPPKDLHTFMIKVDRYINQEETLRAFTTPGKAGNFFIREEQRKEEVQGWAGW